MVRGRGEWVPAEDGARRPRRRPRAPAKAKAAKTVSSNGKPRGRAPKGMEWSAELQQWVLPESGEGVEPAAAAAIAGKRGLPEATGEDPGEEEEDEASKKAKADDGAAKPSGRAEKRRPGGVMGTREISI